MKAQESRGQWQSGKSSGKNNFDNFRRHEMTHALYDQFEIGDEVQSSIKKMRKDSPEKLTEYLQAFSRGLDYETGTVGGEWPRNSPWMSRYEHKEMVDALLASNLKDDQAVTDVSWGMANEMLAELAYGPDEHVRKGRPLGAFGTMESMQTGDMAKMHEGIKAMFGGGDVAEGEAWIEQWKSLKFNKGFVPNFGAQSEVDYTNFTTFLQTADIQKMADEMVEQTFISRASPETQPAWRVGGTMRPPQPMSEFKNILPKDRQKNLGFAGFPNIKGGRAMTLASDIYDPLEAADKAGKIDPNTGGIWDPNYEFGMIHGLRKGIDEAGNPWSSSSTYTEGHTGWENYKT